MQVVLKAIITHPRDTPQSLTYTAKDDSANEKQPNLSARRRDVHLRNGEK